MDPVRTHRLVEALGRMLETLDQKGISPVVLPSPALRLPLRRLLERFFPQLAVVSINEILPEVNVEAVGVIKGDED